MYDFNLYNTMKYYSQFMNLYHIILWNLYDTMKYYYYKMNSDEYHYYKMKINEKQYANEIMCDFNSIILDKILLLENEFRWIHLTIYDFVSHISNCKLTETWIHGCF